MAHSLKAVIVDPDGTFRSTEIDNDFRSFQDAIGGGYIQGVFGSEATMYVDEEGLLKSLPPNPFATLFAQRILKAQVFLVGTALILGPPDEEGNDTDVRPSVVEHFQKEN